MKSKLYKGYTVFENGIIVGKFGKVLKPRIDGCGYERIVISEGGENQSQISIHRLVALMFIPNPDNKPEVNHKDRNKSNNSKENLEWCTRSENNFHAPSQKGRFGVLSAQSKTVLNVKTGKEYVSIREAAKSINIKYATLLARINRYKIGDFVIV